MKRYALLLLLAVAPPAAAAPLDMNTQTCQDWLDADSDVQELMIGWLRGYASGRSTGALFDVARVRADALALKRYCQGHLTVGLVSAAGQWGR
jgi:hypothetical protein